MGFATGVVNIAVDVGVAGKLLLTDAFVTPVYSPNHHTAASPTSEVPLMVSVNGWPATTVPELEYNDAVGGFMVGVGEGTYVEVGVGVGE